MDRTITHDQGQTMLFHRRSLALVGLLTALLTALAIQPAAAESQPSTPQIASVAPSFAKETLLAGRTFVVWSIRRCSRRGQVARSNNVGWFA
jgi:hypothetical protein